MDREIVSNAAIVHRGARSTPRRLAPVTGGLHEAPQVQPANPANIVLLANRTLSQTWIRHLDESIDANGYDFRAVNQQ